MSMSPPTMPASPFATDHRRLSTASTSSHSSTDTLPDFVFRLHRASSQTRYCPEGFRSKNQTTIINQISNLHRFGTAHLNGDTNISSPFISVYSDRNHAARVAHIIAEQSQEEVIMVTINTAHLARGPIFRVDRLLADSKTELSACKIPGLSRAELHTSEYLIEYRIPIQAIVHHSRFVPTNPTSGAFFGNPHGAIGQERRRQSLA